MDLIPKPVIDRSPLLGHEAVTGHVRLPSGIDVGFIEIAIREEGERRYARWSVAANDHGVLRIRTERIKPSVRGNSIADLPDHRVPAELAHDIRHLDRAGAMDIHRSVLRILPNERTGKSQLHDFVAYNMLRSSTKGAVISNLEERLRVAFDPVLQRLGSKRLSLGLKTPPRQDGISLLSMPIDRMHALHAFLTACPWVAELALSDLKRLVGIDLSEPGKAAATLLAGFGIQPAAARRMGPHAGLIGFGTLKLLKAIPVDWVPVPGDREGWAAFQATAYLLRQIDGEAITGLVAFSRGRWPDFVAQIARAARKDHDGIVERWAGWAQAEARDFPSPSSSPLNEATKSLREAVDSAFDMKRALLNTIARARPGSEFNAVCAMSSEMLVGSRGLPALLEASERWHREASAANVLERERIDWPTLFPAWTHPGTGVTVSEVPDSHQLAAEGMKGNDLDGNPGLNHCVGNESYAIGCATGHARILTVRQGGSRLSTAEIELRGRDDAPKVRQHRGFGNGMPGQAAVSALEAYMALPSVLQAAATPIEEARSPGFVLSFEGTFAAWRPYLTGPWRTMTAEDALARIADLPSVRDPMDIPLDMGGLAP